MSIEGVALAPSTPPTAPVVAPVAPPVTAPVVAPGNAAPAAPVTTDPGISLSPPAPVAPVEPTTDVWAGLPEDQKAIVTRIGAKTPADVIKSFKELETKFSSTRPTEAPTDITGYDEVVVAPENAEAIQYNDGFAKWFKETSLAGKVPKEIAKHYHDEFVKWAGTQAGEVGEANNAATVDRVNKSGTSLREAWGEPNTPQFARSLDMSQRAIRNLDPDLRSALVETGALVVVDGKEMVANAVIVRALAKAGAAMYAEDTVFGPTADNANPFDPATLDLTAQSRIFAADKQKAKSLIMALKPEHRARHASLLAAIG